MLKATENLISFSVNGEDDFSPDAQELQALAKMIEKFAPYDGSFNLPGVGARVLRDTKVTLETSKVMSMPGICIVAQGAKRVALGEKIYEYDESRMVVYAAEVLVKANIIKASPDEPYLCLVVNIDPKRLNELAIKAFPHGIPKSQEAQAIYVGNNNPKIIRAATRLLDLALQQEDADLLMPLVIDEMLIRLLRSHAGPSIAQLGITDSHAQKIARTITWLKQNYAKQVKVEDLAHIANMSSSAFHQHFKSITSMTPVQFQKVLRLQEARTLMIGKMMDVSSASYEVGYSSVSQFSREYARHFGKSPTKDVAETRAH